MNAENRLATQAVGETALKRTQTVVLRFRSAIGAASDFFWKIVQNIARNPDRRMVRLSG